MNRRGFFGRILGGFAGAVLTRALPTPVHAPIVPLSFHLDDLAMVMEPLPIRHDIIYGHSRLRQEFQCRVESA